MKIVLKILEQDKEVKFAEIFESCRECEFKYLFINPTLEKKLFTQSAHVMVVETVKRIFSA